MTRHPRWVLVAIALLAVVACGTDPDGEQPEPDESPTARPESPSAQPDPAPDPDADPDADAEVSVTVVAADLEVPWDVAFTDDGRTFVTERDRGVLSELDDTGQPTVRATLPVEAAGEGGLLGVAASPDFADDQTLFVYYTTGQDNRIARITPGGDPEPILTGIPQARVHNGGRVAFGPDGMLYATTGDAGDPSRSPDPGSLAGKILRVNPDGTVPDDNPMPDSPVYASGIRNSQGLVWDADGTLIVTEFGPDLDDAVLRVQPGSDQGWNPRSADAPAGVRDFPDPIAVEQPPEASWSGASFLRGGAVPQWEGNLFVAGLRGQRLWRFDLATGQTDQHLVEEYGRLRHVTQAPDGSLWVLTSNRDGRGIPVADDDRILRLGEAE